MRIWRQVFLILILNAIPISLGEAKFNPLNSIRPFQQYKIGENGESFLANVCTAWATTVNMKHVWITAMHCIDTDDEGNILDNIEYFIDKKPVYLLAGKISNDPAVDIAIFTGGPTTAPLQIALGSPNVPDYIWTAGYPMGSERQHVVTGTFGNIRDDDGFTFYALPVAPGLSGSPVLTRDGLVVGVLRRSECPKYVIWCPVSAGTSTAELRQFLFGQ